MIEVTVAGNDYEPKDEFPRLMRVKDFHEKIVFFIDYEEGIVVNNDLTDPGECDRIGLYSASWDMGDFEDFTGEVTLRNA